MVALNNGAEGGTTGAAVTAGNSGGASGVAWDSVSGSLTYDTAHAYGSLSYKVDLAASSTSRLAVWSTALGTQSEIWGRLYLWTGAAPVGNRVGLVRGVTGGGQCFRIAHETDGRISFRDAGNGDASGTMVTANPLPTSQWVRLEWHVIPLASTGTAELRVYHSADSTGSPDQTLSSTSANLVAGVDTIQFGAFVGASITYTAWLDLLNINTTGWPGVGAVVVSPTGIASAGGWGSPTVTPGVLAVSPAGVASGEAWGSPIVDLGSTTLAPTGIGSAEAFGTPAVTVESVTISPVGIPSGEAWGTPLFFRAWFMPPTVAEGPVADGPLFSRYKLRRGISVVKWADGSYSSLRYPAQTDLESAVRVYLGGHSYELNASEASELTAAGYGDYIEYG